MQNSNFEAEERRAGQKAASALTSAVRSVSKSTFNRKSGAAERSRVTSRYRSGHLDRLVLNAPHYSFKNHFGSAKTGTTPPLSRDGANVRSFQRYMGGGRKVQQVNAHRRSGGSVEGHRKGINYKAFNHIANALKSTNALQQLADDLGNNRIVDITSQIDF